MQIKSIKLLSLAVFLCTGVLVLTAAARAQSYTYTAIDDPLGVGSTHAEGINSVGDIVGFYYDNIDNTNGFLYSGGTYTAIDYSLGGNSTANGINNSGEIVGYYQHSNGQTYGVLAVNLWQNAVATGNGWYNLSWFGDFTTNSSPWIFHQTLGWLYPFAASTNSIWFWDPQWETVRAGGGRRVRRLFHGSTAPPKARGTTMMQGIPTSPSDGFAIPARDALCIEQKLKQALSGPVLSNAS